jgi:hypothetical protein
VRTGRRRDRHRPRNPTGPSGAGLSIARDGRRAPRTLESSIDLIEEGDALDAVGSPDRQAQWARLPRNAQRAWLSMLVARTRALKELPSTGDATKARVKELGHGDSKN